MRSIDGTEALARARELRRNATGAEKRLWAELRNRRLAGFKFRWQVWIGGYIADFLCVEAKLIVELDGSQHGDSNYDTRRDAWLEAEGYRVLRFWNNQVSGELDAVLEAIRTALVDRVPSGCSAAGFALSSCLRHDDALRPSHRSAAGPSLSLRERGE